MKFMKLAKLTALLAASAMAVSVHASTALMGKIQGWGTDMVAGAFSTQNAYIQTVDSQYNPIGGGYVAANGSWTGSIPDQGSATAYDTQLFHYSACLKNASIRSTIGPNDSLTANFTCSTDVSGGFSFTIWGPTLNNYGLTGAQNFYWVVLTTPDGSNWTQALTGSGEANNVTIPGSPLYIRVVVNSSDSFNGSILPQINSKVN